MEVGQKSGGEENRVELLTWLTGPNISTKVLNNVGAFYLVEHEKDCCLQHLQTRDDTAQEHHHYDAATEAQTCWSGG